MKAGWQTSEFWLTVALDIGSLASALQGSLPPKWAGIAAAVSTSCYALSRGITKTGKA